MLFIDNKYTIWYNSIISRAKNRNTDISVYTETHHIIPRSLGGDNSSSNLVRLTGHEHLVCHLLLRKMTVGVARQKMSFAALCMATMVNPHQKRIRITGRLYETLRKERSEALRVSQTGKKHTAERCQNISKAKLGKKYGPQTEIHKQRCALANQGKKKPRTDEWQASINAGIERSKKTCEYCGILCSKGNYTKWHGPNCKHK